MTPTAVPRPMYARALARVMAARRTRDLKHDAYEKARAHLEWAVRDAHADGAAVADLAEAAGTTRQWIYILLRKGTQS